MIMKKSGTIVSDFSICCPNDLKNMTKYGIINTLMD